MCSGKSICKHGTAVVMLCLQKRLADAMQMKRVQEGKIQRAASRLSDAVSAKAKPDAREAALQEQIKSVGKAMAVDTLVAKARAQPLPSGDEPLPVPTECFMPGMEAVPRRQGPQSDERKELQSYLGSLDQREAEHARATRYISPNLTGLSALAADTLGGIVGRMQNIALQKKREEDALFFGTGNSFSSYREAAEEPLTASGSHEPVPEQVVDRWSKAKAEAKSGRRGRTRSKEETTKKEETTTQVKFPGSKSSKQETVEGSCDAPQLPLASVGFSGWGAMFEGYLEAAAENKAELVLGGGGETLSIMSAKQSLHCALWMINRAKEEIVLSAYT